MANWRYRTKFVAWVDLVFTVLSIFALILAIVLAHVWLENLKKDEELADESAQNALSGASIFLWIISGVLILLSFLQLYAAWKLKKSTDVGVEPSERLRMAKIWLIVSVVFLVFAVVGGIGRYRWIALIVALVIRGSFIFIVYKYRAGLAAGIPEPIPQFKA